MRTAVSHLRDEQRSTIERAYVGGLSHSELADRLGVPPGTVKPRIRLAFHAVQAFRGQCAAEYVL
jgi:RNA polymerase sigma-70 factor (ECF subfamily)